MRVLRYSIVSSTLFLRYTARELDAIRLYSDPETGVPSRTPLPSIRFSQPARSRNFDRRRIDHEIDILPPVALLGCQFERFLDAILSRFRLRRGLLLSNRNRTGDRLVKPIFQENIVNNGSLCRGRGLRLRHSSCTWLVIPTIPQVQASTRESATKECTDDGSSFHAISERCKLYMLPTVRDGRIPSHLRSHQSASLYASSVRSMSSSVWA